MGKNQLKTFSHGVPAIIWLIPDRRIERILANIHWQSRRLYFVSRSKRLEKHSRDRDGYWHRNRYRDRCLESAIKRPIAMPIPIPIPTFEQRI